MTVYVDDMHATEMGHYRRMKMSHMIADTDEELNAMADRIGVARRWHQGDHYDIALSKRALAVQYGATEITLKQCAMMSAFKRWKMPMGDPSTVKERWLAERDRRMPLIMAVCTKAMAEGDVVGRKQG